MTGGSHDPPVARTLTTVCPFRCDDAAIAYTKSVKTATPDPQVEGRERCSFDSAQDRPMACDWLSIAVSPVGSNHRVGSKGRKASAPNQTESHVEQVATTLYLRTAQVWITKVKVCMYASLRLRSGQAVMRNVPRLAGENLPTLAR